MAASCQVQIVECFGRPWHGLMHAIVGRYRAAYGLRLAKRRCGKAWCAAIVAQEQQQFMEALWEHNCILALSGGWDGDASPYGCQFCGLDILGVPVRCPGGGRAHRGCAPFEAREGSVAHIRYQNPCGRQCKEPSRVETEVPYASCGAEPGAAHLRVPASSRAVGFRNCLENSPRECPLGCAAGQAFIPHMTSLEMRRAGVLPISVEESTHVSHLLAPIATQRPLGAKVAPPGAGKAVQAAFCGQANGKLIYTRYVLRAWLCLQSTFSRLCVVCIVGCSWCCVWAPMCHSNLASAPHGLRQLRDQAHMFRSKRCLAALFAGALVNACGASRPRRGTQQISARCCACSFRAGTARRLAAMPTSKSSFDMVPCRGILQRMVPQHRFATGLAARSAGGPVLQLHVPYLLA